MYKKLILTFTLAAGLSVLPNAFAAPSNPTPGEPAPKPNTTNTTKHGEDSIDVFAVDMTTAPEPKYKRPGRPPPKGRYGEDSATVLAWKNPLPPPRRPRNHGEDSTIV